MQHAAEMALEFLKRVDLKGAEAQAMTHTQNWLNQQLRADQAMNPDGAPQLASAKASIPAPTPPAAIPAPKGKKGKNNSKHKEG